ncbi:hypothetical protein [Carboxylicivirga caseinilyticus]|uniref:hypothetical protein n=1 Tax=Carboxylicivirga caseinilyticus TaxID=3417572 RepID=UPI003D3584EC|nr:hypothetical protein [Marinilabiliaceae bacterium A049]
MKKLLLITAVLAFVMASCGEKKKKDTESTEATPQQEVVEKVEAAADTLQVTLEEAAQDIKETTEKLDEALKELE